MGDVAPPRSTTTGTFSIRWWRGYVHSTFYFELPDGEVLESPSFRWRRPVPPPDEERFRMAYDALVVLVRLRGFELEPAGAGESWFAGTYTCLVEVAAEESRVAPPAPTAVEQVSPPPPPPPPAPLVGCAPAAERPAAVLEDAPRPRRRRRALGIAVAGIAAAAAVFGAVETVGADVPAARPAGHHVSARPSIGRSAPRSVLTVPTHRARTTPSALPATVEVVLSPQGHGSWVEARRGSQSGKVLYAGILAGGRVLRFRERRLWVRAGAAGNLSITENGRPVRLTGTYDKLFDAPRP